MTIRLAILLITSAIAASAGAPGGTSGERLEHARLLGSRGTALFEAGRLAEAARDLEQAAGLYRSLGAAGDERDCLILLGLAHVELGDHQAALGPLRRGLDLARKTRSRTEELAAHLFLADALAGLGRRGEEAEQVQAAVDLARATGRTEALSTLLGRLGEVEWRLGRFEAAVEHYEEALSFADRMADPASQRAALRQNLATVLIPMGRHRDAEALLLQALEHSRRSGDPAAEAADLNALGALDRRQGRGDQAMERFRRAEELYLRAGAESGLWTVRMNIALVHAEEGRYGEAGALFEAGVEAARRLGNPDLLGRALSGVAFIARLQGRYDEARKLHGENLALRRHLGDREGEATVLNNLGGLELVSGRYEVSLSLFEQSLEIRREIGDAEGEVVSLFHSALAYSQFGRFEEGLARYEAALRRARELGDRRVEAMALRDLAQVLVILDRPDLALGRANEAVAVVEGGRGALPDELAAVQMRAAVLVDLGRLDPAWRDARRAVELSRRLGDRYSETQSLWVLGAVAFAAGDLDGAEAAFRESLGVHPDLSHVEDSWPALVGLAWTHRRLGDRRASIEAARRAVAAFELSLGEVTSGLLAAGFAPAAEGLYTRLVLDLVVEGEGDEAFEVAEAARARGLLAALGGSSVPRLAAGTEPESEAGRRVAELAERIRAVGREIELAKRTVEGAGGSEVARLLDELDRLRRQYEAALALLERNDPEAASFLRPRPQALPTLQEHLPPAATLVSYFTTDAGTLAWIVSREERHLVRLAPTGRDLEAAVTELRHRILTNEDTGPTARRLYRDLVEPIRAYLQTERVLVVPHGALHHLPFAALQDPASGRYLVEDFTLSLLPSASVLPWLEAKRSGYGGRALVLGDPDGTLPGAAREALAVAALLEASPLIGQAASETALRTRAPGKDMIHLAAHAVLDPARPLFSRIELAEDGTHDGALEVHEVFQLDLSEADVVVLSACETGLGALSAGDDLQSLGLAFFRAGAPAVITTLWRVEDDSTQALFEIFYWRLGEGNAPAAALRKAQLHLLRDERWSAPRHWAGIALQGAGWR